MKFNELLSYFKHQLIVKYNLARHELNYNSKLTYKAPMSYLKLITIHVSITLFAQGLYVKLPFAPNINISYFHSNNLLSGLLCSNINMK